MDKIVTKPSNKIYRKNYDEIDWTKRSAKCDKCGRDGVWLGHKFKCISCQREIPSSQIKYD